MAATALPWIGIILCISQAAILSGLNLAVFSLGRLRLQVEAASGNPRAITVQRLRENANQVLTCITNNQTMDFATQSGAKQIHLLAGM